MIANHKVFLSVGHDEYWSGVQRANVEAARNAGVHLAFFSGNEVLLEDAAGSRASTARRRRTGRWSATRKRSPTRRSIRRPRVDRHRGATRASARPPTAAVRRTRLTGTMWTVNCRTYAITVPSEMGAHRFWRNTASARCRRARPASLSSNSLGYEWDEDLNNGVASGGPHASVVDDRRRAGEIRADGLRRRAGHGDTLAHALPPRTRRTVRRLRNRWSSAPAPVQWSWGLDGAHDRGGSTPDARMQQATINLFADMGVQPGSIQAGTDRRIRVHRHRGADLSDHFADRRIDRKRRPPDHQRHGERRGRRHRAPASKCRSTAA